MTWTRLSDGFNGDPELQSISRDARLLHVETLVWCNSQLTDGRVPISMLRRISDSESIDDNVDELLEAGIWERLDGTTIQVDWEDQECASDVLQRQRSRAEKQRRYRQRKALHESGNHSQCDPSQCPAISVTRNDNRNDGGNGDRNDDGSSDRNEGGPVTPSRPVPTRPDPARPDPTRPSSGTGTGAKSVERSPRGSRMTPDWLPSDKCHDALGAEYTDLNLALELDAFRDHWLSKGEVRKDWDAGFRNWCRNARKYNIRSTPANRRTNGLTDDQWQAAFERAQAADRAELLEGNHV